MALCTVCGCQGSPTYHETFNSPDFRAEFEQTELGPLFKAPDTPYVARGGRKQLYFIDTRQDPETAAQIKEQIERASIAEPDELLWTDEKIVTAGLKKADGRVVFTCDPPYGRVLWAHIFNKKRPELNLPLHAPAGGWEVAYSPETSLAVDKAFKLTTRPSSCSRYGCDSNYDCLRQSHKLCDYCNEGRVDNECQVGVATAIHICHPLCGKKIDTRRLEGESDTEYYQRMDILHWGGGHKVNLDNKQDTE